MNVIIKDLPNYHVAYIRRFGEYGPEIGASFAKLMQWADPRGLLTNGTTMSVFWDNPEVIEPESCRTDACLTVPGSTETYSDIRLQTLPGGKCAIFHLEGDNTELSQAWQTLFKSWLPSSGYQADTRPPFEIYYNDAAEHPENKWFVDICIPITSS